MAISYFRFYLVDILSIVFTILTLISDSDTVSNDDTSEQGIAFYVLSIACIAAYGHNLQILSGETTKNYHEHKIARFVTISLSALLFIITLGTKPFANFYFFLQMVFVIGGNIMLL